MSQEFRSIVCGNACPGVPPGRITAQQVKGRCGMRILAGIGTLAVCASMIVLSGCSDEATAPEGPSMSKAGINALAAEVRQLTAGRRIGPLEPAPFVRPALAHLGQALAFDKILSGNRDISCMTCHLPSLGTGDFR